MGGIPVSLSAVDRASQLSYMQKWLLGSGWEGGYVSLSAIERANQLSYMQKWLLGGGGGGEQLFPSLCCPDNFWTDSSEQTMIRVDTVCNSFSIV